MKFWLRLVEGLVTVILKKQDTNSRFTKGKCIPKFCLKVPASRNYFPRYFIFP